MKYQFCKMNGLGNDFIIVDGRDNQLPKDLSKFAISICNRHFGIGADGVLVILNSNSSDIKMLIINSDGTRPEMCGNGIRCFAAYVYKNGIVKKQEMSVETDAGVIKPKLVFKNGELTSVEVDMGCPHLEPKSIPFGIDFSENQIIDFPYETSFGTVKLNCVSMGNPHAVTFWPSVVDAPVEELGAELEKCPLFPEKANIEFVEVVDKGHIKVRVHERGCGETLACGTGACASLVATVLNNLTDKTVDVDLPGGTLNCSWNNSNHLIMTGSVCFVAEGTYEYLESAK